MFRSNSILTVHDQMLHTTKSTLLSNGLNGVDNTQQKNCHITGYFYRRYITENQQKTADTATGQAPYRKNVTIKNRYALKCKYLQQDMLLFKTSGETYCAVPTKDLLRDLDLSSAFSEQIKIIKIRMSMKQLMWLFCGHGFYDFANVKFLNSQLTVTVIDQATFSVPPTIKTQAHSFLSSVFSFIYKTEALQLSSVFLSCVSILTREMRNIDIANLSVRPSVHYVPVPYENGLIYRHSFYTLWQPNNSSFTSIKHFHKIPTGSHFAGALNTGGV